MERPREEDNWVLEVYEVEVEENEALKLYHDKALQYVGEFRK